MLWLTIWGVLIVGTLIGALLLGLRLYRQVRRFLRQLNETTVVLERLTERIDELERLRGEDPTFTPALAATAVDRARWRRIRDENRAHRARRSRQRHARTLERWRLERVVLGSADRRFRMTGTQPTRPTPPTQTGEQ